MCEGGWGKWGKTPCGLEEFSLCSWELLFCRCPMPETSSPGWMGLWATWFSWRCPCLLPGNWTGWPLKVTFCTNCYVILISMISLCVLERNQKIISKLKKKRKKRNSKPCYLSNYFVTILVKVEQKPDKYSLLTFMLFYLSVCNLFALFSFSLLVFSFLSFSFLLAWVNLCSSSVLFCFPLPSSSRRPRVYFHFFVLILLSCNSTYFWK